VGFFFLPHPGPSGFLGSFPVTRLKIDYHFPSPPSDCKLASIFSTSVKDQIGRPCPTRTPGISLFSAVDSERELFCSIPMDPRTAPPFESSSPISQSLPPFKRTDARVFSSPLPVPLSTLDHLRLFSLLLGTSLSVKVPGRTLFFLSSDYGVSLRPPPFQYHNRSVLRAFPPPSSFSPTKLTSFLHPLSEKDLSSSFSFVFILR